jgi:hypothetical protein
MIPKVIHYCWFGGKPLPKSALKCIQSWKKYFPEYEIKRWDESNFDVNAIAYTRTAYKAKKYAFVSDYARFLILYREGGLYFDTDVEIIKNFDDILEKGPFMGCENPAEVGATPNNLGVAPGLGLGVNPGLGLGVNPGLGLYKEILDFYQSIDFVIPDGAANPETVVTYVTRLLVDKGLKNTPDIQEVAGVKVYPSDYFCPISTKDGKMRITNRTHSIHWYDQSWQSPMRKYGRKIILKLSGTRLKDFIKKLIYKNK